MSAITIDISTKSYQAASSGHAIIANLQLQVYTNQFVCLVGPSGCGKTTLLNIIAGLDRQYSGNICINGATHAPHIGYVFQNPRLLPWYNVRRNIELVFSSSPPADYIDALLQAMQLQDEQHRFPQQLSLGMQRRVSIIRAFAINPDILLMDEPFVSLDAPTARQIRHLLYDLWQQRPHTILFVSHDLREAIALADRLIFLSARPMQLAADIIVPLDRLQRLDSVCIEAFRQTLLDDYPAIQCLL